MTMNLAFIGFGEAGRAFADSLDTAPVAAVRAFDIVSRPGAPTTSDRATALAGAGAIWCLVTADRATDAARECAPHLAPGALWFDGNSCSPGNKRVAAEVIATAGGRYVDVAIMAPVHPLRARVPLLVSGPHADAGAAVLQAMGMNPTVVGDSVGQASTIKMLRSVMIKGIEALTAECLLAARKAGVDNRVLGSLQASDPGFDWAARSAYNLERMAVHGARRAAEMEEVGRTLRELGLPDRMATATAQWQAEVAALRVSMQGDPELAARADRILSALSGT